MRAGLDFFLLIVLLMIQTIDYSVLERILCLVLNWCMKRQKLKRNVAVLNFLRLSPELHTINVQQYLARISTKS